jgi:hypothetical protein
VRPSFTSCQGSKVSLHWQTLRVGVLLVERELCSQHGHDKSHLHVTITHVCRIVMPLTKSCGRCRLWNMVRVCGGDGGETGADMVQGKEATAWDVPGDPGLR